jgi:hypothetical protein
VRPPRPPVSAYPVHAARTLDVRHVFGARIRVRLPGGHTYPLGKRAESVARPDDESTVLGDLGALSMTGAVWYTFEVFTHVKHHGPAERMRAGGRRRRAAHRGCERRTPRAAPGLPWREHERKTASEHAQRMPTPPRGMDMRAGCAAVGRTPAGHLASGVWLRDEGHRVSGRSVEQVTLEEACLCARVAHQKEGAGPRSEA